MPLRWITLFILVTTALAQGQIQVGTTSFVRALNERGAKGEWVLYEQNAPQTEANRRWLTRSVLVELRGATAASLATLPGVVNVKEQGRHAVVTFGGEPSAGLDGAKRLRRVSGVGEAQPMLARQQQRRLIPDDPLFGYQAGNAGYQWHLLNTGDNGGLSGIDLNVTSVWDSHLGTGIRIGIVDDGLQVAHPDLAANADTANDYDFNGRDDDPTPSATDGHGTACAGVAAARGNNGLGVSGVAPAATLVGLRLIAAPTTDLDEAEALAFKQDIIDIKSNSWGPFDNAFGASGPGPLSAAALETAAMTGRGGRGTVFLWAAGNGGNAGDDSNYDGWAASPYALAVGAVGDDGDAVWYGEPGANILVCAPSNGGAQGITTTDLMGANGYATGDYTSSFGGTSSATPAVAGVVALMLEANPNLGYRDVQEILMRTAITNQPNSSGWVRNGAGFDFHPQFGAGMVNAQAAVTMATTWANLPPRQTRRQSALALNLPIPDGGNVGASQGFEVAAVDSLRLEHVTVRVKATHPYRGQLQWWLTSPSGVRVRLARSRASDTGANLDWTFMTTHFWGERSEGPWTVQVQDTVLAEAGVLQEAEVTFYGTPVTGDLPAPVITSSLSLVGREGGLFDYQITASHFPSAYAASGLPLGLTLNPGTGRISGLPLSTGAHLGQISATNASGTTTEFVLIYILPADPTLSEAVDQPTTLAIVPFGRANWFRQTDITQDGVDAAQSGAIGHDEYSGMEFTVTGPSVLAFQWKVSSEQNYDYLVLTVDGVVKAFVSGEVDWTPVTQAIGPGMHQVDIYYLKDEIIAAGLDAGWVDAMTLTPITTAPVVANASFTAYENELMQYQIVASQAPTLYEATGLPDGLTLSPSTGLISGRTTALGTHVVTITATNDFGTGTGLLTLIIGAIHEGLAQAMDAPAQTITTTGDVSWRIQSLYSHDGSDAARSGVIADMQSSGMSTQVIGPAKIGFWWGISSEAGYDYLRFHIDGVEQHAISGEVNWTYREYKLPAGVHALTWEYRKDEYVQSGLDSGFVDEFRVHADADGDGFFADEEALFGTSDEHGDSGPVATLAATEAGFTLAFPSVPGQAYRIQTSTNLINWTSQTITATAATTTWTDTTASGTEKRFYRVATP